MPFCGFCGEHRNDGDRFCTSCGADSESNGAPLLQPQSTTEIRWTNKVFGFTSDFYVNFQGAGQQASKATSQLNTGLSVAGALLGSLTAAGAGMIAKGQEDLFIGWDEARSVALNPGKKTVTVTRKSFVFPVRLYCTEENYVQVEAFIREHVNPDLIKG